MAKTQVPGSYIKDDAITTAKIADNTIQAAHLHSSHGITTNNIGEHTNNKYYTDARVDTRLAASKSSNFVTTGNIDIDSDTGKLRVGAGADLRIYHNGTDSYLDNFTGNLVIQQGVNDADILFKSDDGSGGTTTYMYLDGSETSIRFAQNLRIDDGVRARFGASNDLQIYHSGTHSFVSNTTGNLYIQDDGYVEIGSQSGEVYIGAVKDGAVNLRYDNVTKLATTSSGVSVTGTVDTTGQVTQTIAGSNYFRSIASSSGNAGLYMQNTSRNWFMLNNSAGTLELYDGTASAVRMNINTSGHAQFFNNLTVTGNLTVNGSQTVLNTATLDVEDKNITLNKGSGDTSSTADGAGITIQDAVNASTDATILWDATNDEFDFSHPLNITGRVVATGVSQFADVNIPDNNAIRFGNSQDLQIYHDGSNSYIRDIGTGNLNILADQLKILNAAGTENKAFFVSDGGVYLYHNNSAKLETTSAGIDVTGVVTSTGVTFTNGGARYLTGPLNSDLVINAKPNDTTEGLRLQINGVDKLFIKQDGSSNFSGNINSTAITSTGIITGTQLKSATSSTSAAVLKLEDTGVATYDFSFPDTSTILLGVNDQSGTTSNKVLKLLNAGSGTLGLNVEGAATFNSTVSSGAITSTGVTGTTLIQAVGLDSNGFADVEIKSTGTTGSSRLYFSDTAAKSGSIKYSHSDNSMQFATTATTALTINSSQNATFAGNVTTGYTIQAGAYKLGSTVVMNSSRDLTNIGTISSGAITSSASLKATDYRVNENNSLAGGLFKEKNVTGSGSSNDLTIFAESISNGGNIHFMTGGSSTIRATIDSSGKATFTGNVQHTGLTMTSGTDIDQLTTATDSLTLSDAWQDTSIAGSDLATGTYIVQVYADDYAVGGQHYAERYSGTMSWHGSSTNSTGVDEIILHRAGHAANNGDIYLRTQRHSSGTLMLQIRGSLSNTGASNYIFKFRRMI